MRSVQERVVREIRTLRAMWRGLETESWTTLLGHEGGNPGHRQGETYHHRASPRPYRAPQCLVDPHACCAYAQLSQDLQERLDR
jgi:hypothetical protein